MKAFKFFAMMIAMLAISINFSSCDDGEEPITEIKDYYIECDVKGGDLNASELSTLKSELNVILSEVDLDALTKDEAIYLFDKFIQEMKYAYSDGIGTNETLSITFYLKTTSGNLVKKTVLKVTKDGCPLG